MADDYISREAASERLHKLIVNFYSAYEKDGKDERLAALLELDLAARSVINAIPAADVAEVRHGRWTEWDDGEGDTFECSVCGEPWTLNAGTPKENNMHYCPNCGAKMDESEFAKDTNVLDKMDESEGR